MRRFLMGCATASSCVVLSVIGLLFFAATASATTAQFSLHVTSPDAVLDLNNPADNTLNLELWVTLDSAPGGLFGYSTYVKPSSDGVIAFNPASFTDLAGLGYAAPQGVDNKSTDGSSLSGAFSRGMGTFPPVPFSAGSTKLASFAVTAVDLGTVHYGFLNDLPVRPLCVTLGTGTIVTATSNTDLVIQVIPEPASAVLMLACMGRLMVRRRRAFGC